MLLKLSRIFGWLCIYAVIIISPVWFGSVQLEAFFLIFVFITLGILSFIFECFLKEKFELKNTNLEVFFLAFLIYIGCQHMFKIGSIDKIYFFGSICRYETLIQLMKFTAYFLFFLLIVNMVDTKKRLFQLLWLVAIAGGMLSVFAIVQRLSGENIFDSIGITTKPTIYSTFICRSHFAGYLEMVIPIVIAQFCYMLNEVRQKTKSKNKIYSVKYLLGIIENGSLFICILLFLMISALLVSLSRAGVILIALAFFSFSIFFLTRSPSKSNKKTIFAFLELVFIIAIILAIVIGLDPAIKRFSGFFDSLKIRQEAYLSSFRIVCSYPFFGTGFGTFQYIFPKFQSIYLCRSYFIHAHNDYIELLCDAGIIGFFIFIGAIIFFLIKNRFPKDTNDRGLKFIRFGAVTSIILISIHSLVDFNLQIPSNALMFFTSLAVFYLSGVLGRENTGECRQSRLIVVKSRKNILCFVAPVFLIFLIITGKAQCNIFTAKKIAENMHQNRIHALRLASARDSLNPEYKYKLSTALYEEALVAPKKDRKKLLEEALEEAKSASKLAPTKASFYYRTAKIYNAMGKYSKAEKCISKAIDYAPVRYRYRIGYAIFCFNRAYKARLTSVKNLYIERGVEQYNVAKKYSSSVDLKKYQKAFVNYDRQIEMIHKIDPSI